MAQREVPKADPTSGLNLWRRPAARATAVALLLIPAVWAAARLLGSGLVLYLAYIGVSFVLGGVAATTVVWALHAWRTPAALSECGSEDCDLAPAHSFSLIIPAREEEAVLESTLSRIAASTHPRFEVLVVVGDDDPPTRAAAERVAARYPQTVRIIVDASVPKSKPQALNAALPWCTGDVTGVFDAEDDVHPALLTRVDQRFQQTSADIVQAGVQLMNFRSSWLTVRNVLEYYFWFRSRLHLHARQGFIPLGGNTVFVRTPILRAVGGWDAGCLAEDCELGVRLSALGAHTVVFYEPALVTREECPPTLGAFVRQRTRWNQGYLQTLSKGYWRRLPFRQRMLGFYVLAMPYLMSLAWMMIPVAIATAVAVKAPVGITLISFVPALPMLAMLVAEVVALGEFCREYAQRASIRDYARLVVGLPFYQGVLSFAAARAVVREARGARSWEKTVHLGLHLDEALPSADEPPRVGARPGGRRRKAVASRQILTGGQEPERRGPLLTPALAFASVAGLAAGPSLPASTPSQPLWTRLDSLALGGAPLVSDRVVGPIDVAEAGLTWLRGRVAVLRSATIAHVDLVIQVALLGIVGLVMATNALHWPATQFDEGTYVGNAWALQHGKLAPYTYSYGHPPLAWLFIFLWTWFTGLFGHTTFSIDAGRAGMVVVNLISCSLLYVLARRLQFGRVAASCAVLLFALSPLAIFFHRAVLLDNPSMAWALAAFVLARSPGRRLWAFAASGACFAASVLSKETSFVLLPALIVAIVQNTDARTRRYSLALSMAVLVLVTAFYPLYATLKGELVPGRGHVSLIGYAIVQLVTRKGTGNPFDPNSQAHGIILQWLHLDPWLLGAGLVALPIAFMRRSTRSVALAYLLQILVILRPGYLPNMYVTQLLPFAALLVPGAIEATCRAWRQVDDGMTAGLLAAYAVIPALIAVIVVVGRWARSDTAAVSMRLDGATHAAQAWIVAHIGHDKRLIVGDEYYVYLIQHGFNHQPVSGGFFSKTVVSYWPLDYDPAVKRQFPHGWRDFNYIVSTEAMRDSVNLTPTAELAIEHSRPVITFGQGIHRIEVRLITPGG